MLKRGEGGRDYIHGGSGRGQLGSELSKRLRLNALIYILAALNQQVYFGLLGSIFLAELGFGLLLFAGSRRLGSCAMSGSTRMSHCAKPIGPIRNLHNDLIPFFQATAAAGACGTAPVARTRVVASTHRDSLLER